VKKHFTEELLKNPNFNKKDYKQALIDNFMKMDEIMQTGEGKIELKNEAKRSKEDDEKLNKSDKNKQNEAFKQLFDPKAQDDCDIAMYTGCTACCVLLDGNKIYCANSGDSRAVLCKKGVAIPLSIDHKPDLDSEKNRIYKADGWVSDGRVKGLIN
jgi:protein phosphatase 1G